MAKICVVEVVYSAFRLEGRGKDFDIAAGSAVRQATEIFGYEAIEKTYLSKVAWEYDPFVLITDLETEKKECAKEENSYCSKEQTEQEQPPKQEYSKTE